ncbi:MAG TPA: RNA 2',3'-cyclic phosphodiesterase, partial [Pirellulaceae bacterium]|nr:RNA 2',3'-cyclic phosphodiesterase [Pirellulaceae bacterium]
FLGNLRDQEVPDVCRVVRDSVQSIAPVSVIVKGLGAFPSIDRPRVIWLGIDEGHDELRALQSAVDDGLRALGFPIERQDYRPHLTLGRLPSGARWGAGFREYSGQYRETAFGGFEVDEVIVYASYLERSGPVYTRMATIELAGS